MVSSDQSRKEGGAYSAARTSCRSRLHWRLDTSSGAPPPPPAEDEEDVFHGGAGVAVTPILLGLVVLRGGTAVEPLEHVALLEGVVDRRLVVGT
jgi:hypothetical protein